MPDPNLPLLNVYEVEVDGATRHLVGFLDPVLAGIKGIDSRAMVGEFTPGPDGEFDPSTFQVNPEFIEAVTRYLNEHPGRSPEVADQARSIPGRKLYLVDPRNTTPLDDDPPAFDVLGAFDVDSEGRVIADTFRYNSAHVWFSAESGISGLLQDRRFYDWLHPVGETRP
jgi:hypothetical protein